MRATCLCNAFLLLALGSCDADDRCSPQKAAPRVFDLMKERRRAWRSKTSSPWQYLVDDKLTGYMYAIHMGVPTPKVYACSRGLPQISPEVWGTNSFVVKPLEGGGSVGVVISTDGVDRITSMPVTNATLKDIYQRHAEFSESVGKRIFAPNTAFMVEEYLKPKDGFQYNGIPADMKFEVYDGNIIFIRYLKRQWNDEKKRASAFCISNYDKDLKPLLNNSRMQTCANDLDKPPPEFSLMKDMVLKLDHGLGAFYRIDMFFTARGPVLGEFTYCPASGEYPGVQACRLLEYWQGDSTPDALKLQKAAKQPDILRGWETMSFMEKCQRVRAAQQRVSATAIA